MLEFLLENTESDKEKCIKELRERKYPVYIYGIRKTSEYVVKVLREAGIEISGYVVDECYYTDLNKEKNIYLFSQIESSHYDIVVGFSLYCISYEKMEKNEIGNKGNVYVVDFKHLIDREYFKGNIDKFQETYSMLQDELSKKTMTAFLQCRMNDKGRALYEVYRPNQYFDDIMTFDRDEVYVDCGMYNGDTIMEFIQRVPEYRHIYGFEIDKSNIKKMESNNIRDLTVINKGVWSRETELSFISDNTSSSISHEGGNKVWTTTIDSVCGDEKVTFIKMDIEGSELEALRGACNTIKKNMPKLAICVYHKKEDLITIPQYLKQFNNEKYKYKFYLRHHGMGPDELVLYGIPIEG